MTGLIFHSIGISEVGIYRNRQKSYLFTIDYPNMEISLVKPPQDRSKYYPLLEPVTFSKSCFPIGTQYKEITPERFADNYYRILEPTIDKVFGEDRESHVYYLHYSLERNSSKMILPIHTMSGTIIDIIAGKAVDNWTMAIGILVIVRA